VSFVVTFRTLCTVQLNRHVVEFRQSHAALCCARGRDQRARGQGRGTLRRPDFLRPRSVVWGRGQDQRPADKADGYYRVQISWGRGHSCEAKAETREPENKAKVNRIWPQDRGQAPITSLAGSRIISASTSAKNKSILCEITLNITVILHSHHLKVIRGDATSVSQSSFAISETVRDQAIVSVERE